MGAGLVRRALALCLLAAGAAPSGAQPVGAAPAAVCRLPVEPPAGVGWVAPASRVPTALPTRPVCTAPTARFEVTYAGFAPDARAAVQAAVDTWSCLVASPVTIRVEARWEPLPASTLGSAGPYLVRDFAGAPLPGTWVPAPLADALAGRDLERDRPDIDAAFNSQFSEWHTDPDAPPPPGAFDLYTVVLHELGHGLGLIGGLTVQDGRGFAGAPDATRGPYVYDRFAQDAAGQPLLGASYPDGSARLADALQAEVWFDGPALRQVGGRARLFSPRPWLDGASYSHLDEATYEAGTPDGLMTPFVRRGETVAAPGATTCALLADLGWSLGGDCAALVGDRERPPSDGLDAVLAGPNPVRGQTRVRVRAAVRQQVDVRVLDAQGRTVAAVPPRGLEPGVPFDVSVDGRGLAAGVYRVVVRGESGTRSVPLVVVR